MNAYAGCANTSYDDQIDPSASTTWMRPPVPVSDTKPSISGTSPRPATPMTSTLPSRAPAAATTSSASPRHTVHHGAQNHSTVSLPANDADESSPPPSCSAVNTTASSEAPALLGAA